MIKPNFRQGDVFILSAEFPKGDSKKVKSKILALGEVTGHSHVLKAINDCKIEVIENADGCYVKISEGEAIVKHEEHGEIIIPEGEYEIRIQREYCPLEYARKVAD